MENNKVEVEVEIAPPKTEELEKYYKYYASMKKSKIKYEAKNRELLNEKARKMYAEKCKDPDYIKARNERMLSYYHKKKALKEQSK
jgi:hypothetical protein